jgi:hypothetical protein
VLGYVRLGYDRLGLGTGLETVLGTGLETVLGTGFWDRIGDRIRNRIGVRDGGRYWGPEFETILRAALGAVL